ncbi:ParA family protein [Bacillus sp. 37MA]|uniref:ParA family protein n=1 Tax=Bacillus sp. 37MA TaxID=1132442 RepID=UPI00036E1D2F|nr:ParA family protein [Bacillus sp. 37MA]
MAILISFGLQKGGVGKTTTTAITAFILSKTKRVLAVDLDGQGNLTRMLTGKRKSSFEKTIYDVLKAVNTDNCITVVTDTLHVIAANDDASKIPGLVASSKEKQRLHLLKLSLESIQNEYDYILIDLPPALAEQTLLGLTASDYTVTMLQTDPFAFHALDDYLETCQLVKEAYNPKLKLAGILSVLLNSRASLDQSILRKVRDDYEELVFSSVVKRQARIKEFTITGISDRTKTDRKALTEYTHFVEELIERVEKG